MGIKSIQMTPMANEDAHHHSPESLVRDLERELTDRYGLVLDTKALFQALGYPSAAALRQALRRGTLDIPLFEIPRRRGRFALPRDVAQWLVECRGASFAKKAQSQST